MRRSLYVGRFCVFLRGGRYGSLPSKNEAATIRAIIGGRRSAENLESRAMPVEMPVTAKSHHLGKLRYSHKR